MERRQQAARGANGPRGLARRWPPAVRHPSQTANPQKEGRMIRPLGDKIVVEPATEEEKTTGGIILPDTAKQKPQEGKVVAVGTGRVLEDGSRAPMAVKVGDRVIYAKYGGNEITLSGKDYLILDQDSIYAIRE
jgi:chaperonin GroES